MFHLFRKLWRIPATLAGALLLTVVAGDADAGFTSIRQPRRQSEPSQEQILEHVYGGNFVADATGLSFSNESGVTVTRLQDDGASSDQVWTGRVLSSKAVASFGRKTRTASYFGGTSGGQFSKLFETTGSRFDVNGGTGAETTLDGSLTVGRGRKAGRVFSSVAAANRDGMDHLVSYEVKNTGGGAAEATSTYLLCWEDKFARVSDRDYNDMVVEVKTASGAAATAAALTEPLLIPLPAGLWSGLGGLLGLGAIRVIRHAAKHARL